MSCYVGSHLIKELIEWSVVGQHESIQLIRLECIVDDIFGVLGLVESCVINGIDMVNILDPIIKGLSREVSRPEQEIQKTFPTFDRSECAYLRDLVSNADFFDNPLTKEFAKHFDPCGEAKIVTYITTKIDYKS